MNTAKNSKYIFSIFTALIMFLTGTLSVYAEEQQLEDYEFNISRAIMSPGAWGQSITFAQSDFKASKFTPESIVTIEFELDGEPANPNLPPIEMVFQNYSTADPHIWAKITPYEYTESVAYFNYEDMVKNYGFDDLSGVDNIFVGDTGTPIKVTKMTATNVIGGPSVTTITTVETVPEENEQAATAATTQATDNSDSSSGNSPLVPIVIGAVVVAGGVVTFIIIRNKRRGGFY